MPDYSTSLKKYMPEAAAPVISQWINDTGCRFKVTRSRNSKLGDYRAPFKGSSHQITVNHDLNPYSFLITTVHEFAHLKTYQEHKNKVKPHGNEWKENFKMLMEPFLNCAIFPADIIQAIAQYLNNPAASSCTDINLYRSLKRYDTLQTRAVHLEDLPINSCFQLENGRKFQKMEKLRKRYRCIELHTQKVYLFHPIAEVFPSDD